jgi:hypothetical protein
MQEMDKEDPMNDFVEKDKEDNFMPPKPMNTFDLMASQFISGNT